jgi:hypothetical protein
MEEFTVVVNVLNAGKMEERLRAVFTGCYDHTALSTQSLVAGLKTMITGDTVEVRVTFPNGTECSYDGVVPRTADMIRSWEMFEREVNRA